MPKKIVLIPFNSISLEILIFLKNNLEKIFNLPVEEKNPISIPKAYDSYRKQYLSSPFIQVLLKEKKDNEFILGIVEADLYAPGLNFIFGEAAILAGVAVIALARLHTSFYGLPEDKNIFKERVLKEAVHELGHLFGLPHCSNPYCVMHFSNSIIDTDKKSAYFCNSCYKKIKDEAKKL
ncbi:MAG TPA: hypothetical protein ENG63_10165 [Candidatus Desulfofervidus auxilii]|uniref:Archaemetzincin n=1 Tax=Desulfofervidus auxilii TaxID=1621989 RepID=A0A7C0Y451_DESA2|nr:hypothetical protein [Candidatus Desulfofervidus auxilii]